MILGEFEWKRCKILLFDKETERFEIEWLHQENRKKMVSRINLRFAEENIEKFEKKVEDSIQFRKLSEVFFKYNYFIDQIETKTSNLNNDQKDRIMHFVMV